LIPLSTNVTYRDSLTFHIPRLIPIFLCICRSKVSFQIRYPLWHFITSCFFMLMFLRNVHIVPHHYTVWWPGRLGSSSPRKFQVSNQIKSGSWQHPTYQGLFTTIINSLFLVWTEKNRTGYLLNACGTWRANMISTSAGTWSWSPISLWYFSASPQITGLYRKSASVHSFHNPSSQSEVIKYVK
jgi:hypothetical protein